MPVVMESVKDPMAYLTCCWCTSNGQCLSLQFMERRQSKSNVMHVSGDTSNNLWWRIKNGELPSNHMPKVVVLMVGANDLTAAYAQCGTWDAKDYYGAAATIAQQYAQSSTP